MKQRIYRVLLNIAKKGEIITYSDLADKVHFPLRHVQDYKKLGLILIEIDRVQYATTGVLLSACCVRKHIEVPGNGFFNNMRRMGIDVGKNKVISYVRELKKLYKYLKNAS